MRREISTRHKALSKLFRWIIFFICIRAFANYEFDVTSFETWMFAAIFTIWGVIEMQQAFNYKKIEMNETGLFISQNRAGRKVEIFIPFGEITNIRRVPGVKGNAKNYVLELENPTRFGNEIPFNPITKAIEFPENLIINELKDRIRAAKTLPKLKMQNL